MVIDAEFLRGMSGDIWWHGLNLLGCLLGSTCTAGLGIIAPNILGSGGCRRNVLVAGAATALAMDF